MKHQATSHNTGQRNGNNNTSALKYESRRFPRHKIRRQVLLKNSQNRIFTARAYDVSSSGMHLRCPSRVAFDLLCPESGGSGSDLYLYELKIALPYMNTLSECNLQCKIASQAHTDPQHLRLGMDFQFIDSESRIKLDYFLNNLTH